jgi:hypothetical protein
MRSNATLARTWPTVVVQAAKQLASQLAPDLKTDDKVRLTTIIQLFFVHPDQGYSQGQRPGGAGKSPDPKQYGNTIMTLPVAERWFERRKVDANVTLLWSRKIANRKAKFWRLSSRSPREEEVERAFIAGKGMVRTDPNLTKEEKQRALAELRRKPLPRD